MEYISCERDDDRGMIQFWWLQLLFYFNDEDFYRRIKANLKVINTFMKYYIEIWSMLENPFYLMYWWAKDSDINICLQDNNDIYIQISLDNADYFTEQIKTEQLKEILDFLNSLLKYSKTENIK